MFPPEQVAGPAIRIPFWRNWGDIAAVAAVLVLFVGVGLPTLGFARQKYWQARCQANQAAVHEGLANYAAEHEGRLPGLAVDAGSPWWKVGYQGPEDYSNTRQGWRFVREGYVSPEKFLCPARGVEGRVSFDRLKVEDYSDFPHREFIGFSIRINCPQSREVGLTPRKVLMADRNPIAERLPTDYSAEFRLRIDQELLGANSRTTMGGDRTYCSAMVRSSSSARGLSVLPVTISIRWRRCRTVVRFVATSDRVPRRMHSLPHRSVAILPDI